MNPLLDPYALKQASYQASRLVASSAFRPDDWEDIRQELLLDFVRRAPKFDSSRGKWGGFVRGVMQNHATVLAKRGYRRVRHEVLEADLACSDGQDEQTYFETVLQQDPTRELELSVAVRGLLEQLPGHLRRVALLAAELPVTDVQTATGRSRTGVYHIIGQVRQAFVDAGIGPTTGRRRSR